MDPGVVNLLGGIVIGLLTAWVGGWAQATFLRRNERKRSLEEQRFKIYMLLLEAKSWHFWLCSSEINQQPFQPKPVTRFEEMRWRIADELRKADDLPELPRILRVLFSTEFATEWDRSRAIDQVIDLL